MPDRGRDPRFLHAKVNLRARPTLWGAGLAPVVEQLRTVLEVHRIVVIPAAAPDEALGLERVDDGLRNAVAPTDRFCLLPTPVVAHGLVEIDGDPEGVRAGAIGTGNLALGEAA